MQNILITGANGFVGKILVKKLKKKKLNIFLVLRKKKNYLNIKNNQVITCSLLDRDKIKTSRNKIIRSLKKKINLEIFIEGYQNIHQLPIFKKKICYGGKRFPWSLNKNINYNYSSGTLPIAEELHEKTFIGILMCKYDLNYKDIDSIVNCFKKTWKEITFY